MTSSAKLVEQETPEDSLIIKAYCSGANSNNICNSLTTEVYGVDWFLGTPEPLSPQNFENDLTNTDLLIIIADLNDKSEVTKSLLMAQIALKYDIIILLFSTSAIPFHLGNKSALTHKLKVLSEISIIIQLDDSVLVPYFFTGSNFSVITKNLLWKVRAIIELITIQGFVCIDYNDIRWALRNKGLCHPFFGHGEGKDKTALALSDILTKIPKQTLSDAKGVIITLFAGLDIKIDEFELVGNKLIGLVNDDEDIFVVSGVILDEDLADKIVICACVSI